MASRKKKKSGSVNSKSKSNSLVVDLTGPRDPKKSLQMAKDYLAGKEVDLNASLLSGDDCQGNIYDPIAVELGKMMGATFRTVGHKTESNPKGYKESSFRLNHPDSLKRGVILAESAIHDQIDDEGKVLQEAIISLGDWNYIVGTTGKDGESAPYLVDASRTGAFAWNTLVTKQLSFSSMTDVSTGKPVTKTEFGTVVGRINKDPMLISLGDGTEAALFPNEVVEWGHLVKDGKALTPSQVRSLDDDKGIKFEPLPEGGWVGRDVTKSEWSEAFKSYMGVKAKTTGPWYSLTNTQSRRQSLGAVYCFAFRTCCIGQPIGTKPDLETRGEKVVFMALGRYSTIGLSKTVWDVRREEAEAEVQSAGRENRSGTKSKTKKSKTKKTKGDGKKSKSKSKSKSKKDKDKEVDTPPSDETFVSAEESADSGSEDGVTSETEFDDVDLDCQEAALDCQEAALADD